MKYQICTTEEQSKRLIEIGFKKETADMKIDLYYPDEPSITPTDVDIDWSKQDEFVPAWSLTALLEMLPKAIRYNDLIHYLEIQTDEECYDFEYHIFDGEREWYLSGGYDANIFEAIIETFEMLIEKELYKID